LIDEGKIRPEPKKRGFWDVVDPTLNPAMVDIFRMIQEDEGLTSEEYLKQEYGTL